MLASTSHAPLVDWVPSATSTGSDVLQRDRDPWWMRPELADQLCAGGVDRRYPRVPVEPGQIPAQESPGSRRRLASIPE